MLSLEQQRTLTRNLENYEGRINHMYLDSNGYVTVGIGHLLPTATAAQRLPFKNSNGAAATAEQIKADFDTVKQQPGNRLASFYKPHTKLALPDSEIDRITSAHIDSFHHELRIIYARFDTFPWEARLALFDMIFNLGQTNLQRTWPNFNNAIRNLDWASAARHSRRAPPVSEERNRYVRDLLDAAAEQSK